LLQQKQNDLQNTNSELAKSNEELERFNFIASHDLKSPIHNIIS
jgi:light-regulated signal transduction histidine kinase (bacteriophytochrome)